MSASKCKIEGCDGIGSLSYKGTRVFKEGYCCKHYKRLLRHGDPYYETEKPTKCKIKGCNRGGRKYKNGHEVFYLGYCLSHYGKYKRNGDPLITLAICDKVGRIKHPLYLIYQSMKQRCYNPKAKGYNHYGGRGIKIGKRWSGLHGFDNFVSDMGERPSKNHTIDRIRVNGNYTPKNCRWADWKTQRRNTRKTIYVIYNGENISLSQLSENLNLNYRVLLSRISKGWGIDKAIKEPLRVGFKRNNTVQIDGVRYNLRQACAKLELNYNFIYKRMKTRNMTFEQAIKSKKKINQYG